MNKKFSILCLGLLVLPSCGPWNFRRTKIIIPVQQAPALKKAYLSISDIECEDCFKLIQGILLPIKCIIDVSLENEYNGYKDNRIIISYDPNVPLNKRQIHMVLEEWNFDLQKIEL